MAIVGTRDRAQRMQHAVQPRQQHVFGAERAPRRDA